MTSQSYHIETKNNSYTIEDVGFIIGAMKITCTATIYLDNIGNQWPSKVNSVVGFGFSMSEALMRMLDNVPGILSEHENIPETHVSEESFEKNHDDSREGQ